MMKQTLSIFGAGSFGNFIAPHLIPYFDVQFYDPDKNIGDFESAVTSDIILLAVPVQAMESTVSNIAPHLKAGQLVIDVASVKVKIVDILTSGLPSDINIVATHPIFGPQSGKNGIQGQNIAVMNVRGDRYNDVKTFLADKLRLNVIETTADKHDEQMAYVQGLTHMIAKIFKVMDVPEIQQSSKTYEYLQSMVNLIKNDSDDLFRAIQTENPYVDKVKQDFFKTVKELESELNRNK